MLEVAPHHAYLGAANEEQLGRRGKNEKKRPERSCIAQERGKRRSYLAAT